MGGIGRRRTVRIGIALVVLAAAFLCGALLYSHFSVGLRYRIDVTVDDHGTIRHGSAVWGYRLRRVLLPLDSRFAADFHGDAIPVPLQDGKILLVMLNGWFADGDETRGLAAPASLPGDIFGMRMKYHGNDLIRETREIASRPGLTGDLYCPVDRHWNKVSKSGEPTMSQCFDLAIADNRLAVGAIHRFDPACAYWRKDCPIKIRRVTITITHNDADRPLDRIFPWLPSAEDKSLATLCGPIGQRCAILNLDRLLRR